MTAIGSTGRKGVPARPYRSLEISLGIAGLGLGVAVVMGSPVAAADSHPDSQMRDPAAPATPAATAAASVQAHRAPRETGQSRTRRNSPASAAATARRAEVTRTLRPRPSAARNAGPNAGPAAAPNAVASNPAVNPVNAIAPINPIAMRPEISPQEIWVTVGSSLVGLAQSALRQFSVATYLGPTTSTFNQSITLNGATLVPSSTERVNSAYGQWTYWPGGPTLVQGQQKYSLVDPATGQSAGSFEALVSTGSPFNIRSKYVELLVTSTDGSNIGPGPGQIPPVGSLISRFNLLAGFGWSYSALPATDPSAPTTIRFALTTPFGDIPIPMSFDASKGLADRTVDNRPVQLGDGYSIAPADPAGETYLGTSGFLPYYTTVQAREVFNVRDSTGTAVGSFEAVVTPTADIMGVYTQAILVTRVIDGTTGTSPGNVPPVGSVFNVMYRGRDDNYVRYVSMPSPSGDVVSVVAVNGDETRNIRTFPLNLLNASALPAVQSWPTTRGYRLLATSPVTVSGVNGLPPREIQVQGYQQFSVYDSVGVARGSFDADVATQLDMYGIHSQSILVTKVTDGTPGIAPGEVPPVGSVFNYVYFGRGGLGTYYSSMPNPSGSGAKVTFRQLNPVLDLPTFSQYNASAGLSEVVLVDPL